MEDTKKIKPYIAHLNRQLKQLSGEVDKLSSKTLDERLLSLQDEKKKLDLSNRYAYVLSSLCFAYMKVLNVKDLSPVMTELQRCKSYMDRSKELEARSKSESRNAEEQQQHAKLAVQSALSGGVQQIEPAISKQSFQGKHTKFTDEDKDSVVSQVVDRMKKNQKAKTTKRSQGKVKK